MNGKTYLYLELAAVPEVGSALLDPRPAFVFRGDGTAILWANAAGAALLGDKVGAALQRRFAPAGPFARQLARLARLAPADHPRLEILRFNAGARTDTLPAACRRLNLAGGASAVLGIGQAPARSDPLALRAERLVDAIASKDCLAAILAADGRVLAASGGYDDLAPVSAAIDALIERVASAPAGLLREPMATVQGMRPSGIVRFSEGGQRLFLLIIGPPEAGAHPGEAVGATETAPDRKTEPAEVASTAVAARLAASEPAAKPDEAAESRDDAAPRLAADQTVRKELADGRSEEAAPGSTEAQPGDTASNRPAIRGDTSPPVAEPAQGPGPGTTFLWQMDRDRRFTFISPELAKLAGPAASAIVGRTWSEVAERFGFDPEKRIDARLANAASWHGETVYWPMGDGRERIAVALSGIPLLDRSFAGFRGFGVSRPDQRRNGPTIVPFETEPAPPPMATAEPETMPAPTRADDDMPPEARPPPAKSESETVASAEVEPMPGRPVRLRLVDDARKSIEDGAQNTRPGGSTADVIEPPPAPTPAAEVETASGEAGAAAAPTALPASEAAASAAPERAASAGSNIVRLPGAPMRALPSDRLSGSEQDAFRRIAETLGVKLPEGMRTPDERRLADASRAGGDDEAEPDTRLLDKLPVGIVVYRERGILFANRTLLDYLGYDTPEDFAKAGGAEAIFPDRGRGETAFPDAHGILTARRRDGADVKVEARLHAVPWGTATALMLSLIKHEPAPEPVHDDDLVEHLVAAERRIDELATILDTATDGIVIVDQHGRVENVNRSAEALFGVEANAIRNQPFVELLAEESRRPAAERLERIAANGGTNLVDDGSEVVGKRSDGGLVPLFMTMGRLGSGPKLCAVLRDISHWKRVEDELIAAKRAAEAANAQKSEFLAKVSHEIRTPLNAIIGFSEVMMGERFGPIGNERYRDYLRDIHVSGGHLLSLINDLLDLSKIEAGKLELVFEGVAVNDVVQECVALMQPQANRDRIIIRTSLSSGVPKVMADQRSLRQILLNLLSNAIKFTAAGGQVIVATALEESGDVVLRIRDTGIGMSEKDLETAMKPFRQVTSTGIRRGEGTGLGLPLTKALVEANRAAFSIDSAPNQGTLVKIAFPTSRVLAV
jgi:PAS domain S-box-containing protein